MAGGGGGRWWQRWVAAACRCRVRVGMRLPYCGMQCCAALERLEAALAASLGSQLRAANGAIGSSTRQQRWTLRAPPAAGVCSREPSAPRSPGRRRSWRPQVGVIGWGSQAPAQAQNLADSFKEAGMDTKVRGWAVGRLCGWAVDGVHQALRRPGGADGWRHGGAPLTAARRRRRRARRW